MALWSELCRHSDAWYAWCAQYGSRGDLCVGPSMDSLLRLQRFRNVFRMWTSWCLLVSRGTYCCLLVVGPHRVARFLGGHCLVAPSCPIGSYLSPRRQLPLTSWFGGYGVEKDLVRAWSYFTSGVPPWETVTRDNNQLVFQVLFQVVGSFGCRRNACLGVHCLGPKMSRSVTLLPRRRIC